MIILGIDPGLARVGYGLINKQGKNIKIIDSGLITTPASLSISERLILINRGLKKILKKHKPDFVAIEKLFFFKNAKTALSVGQAWGVISFTVKTAGCSIIELTPLQIKQSVTGYGQATKSQVEKMLKLIVGIKSLPKSDDTVDALACAFCAFHYIKPLIKDGFNN